MEIRDHIFRQYDIRGIVGEDLDAEVARAVGRAYGARMRRLEAGSVVAVGRDNRPSSPGLADGLAGGLREAGVDVVDVGTVPTPVVYWAERVLGTDGALQVTGSHNPSEYNGIKMTVGGRALHGDEILELRDLIRSGVGPADREGSLERSEVLDRYVADVAGRLDPRRAVRVAVDCGNGTASVVAVPLLEAVGAEVEPLYCESDGTFPHHHPDPVVDENLADLVERVRDSGAEAGIAFDGDGDRIGVVDERGRVVRGDLLLLLLGLDLLERRGRGQKLVFDVKCSQVLPEVFADAGGRPIMWKTGHSLIKEKMRETGAAIAGELSGHLCFADDYYGFDDALYAACRLVELLSRSDGTLGERVDALPRYFSTPEIRTEVGEEEKFEIVERAVRHFRDRYDVVDVDGVRILFGDGWGLLRASNTQPALVTRYEAKTPERLREIRGVVEDWLAGQGVDG